MNTIYDVLDIKLSMSHTQRVVVPKWETPVLQAQHGDSLVFVEEKIYKRDIPSPSDEFARLAVRYGPRNEDTPYVAAVYGNFGPGVTALRAQIVRSLTDQPETPSDYKSLQDRQDEEQAKYVTDAASMLAEARALQNGSTDVSAVPTAEDIATARQNVEDQITAVADAAEKANIAANPLADNSAIVAAQAAAANEASNGAGEAPELVPAADTAVGIPGVVVSDQDAQDEDLSVLVG